MTQIKRQKESHSCHSTSFVTIRIMRYKIKNRNIPGPDRVHNSDKLNKFINYIMWDGKKNAARSVVYGALDVIKTKGEEKPFEIFEAAIKNVGPTMEVRSRRIGGANYQVPREVRPERRGALAMRWIVAAARGKRGAPWRSGSLMKSFPQARARARRSRSATTCIRWRKQIKRLPTLPGRFQSEISKIKSQKLERGKSWNLEF